MPDDDEIIRKIQEAPERYQPVYDEASWADMQRLLDEHLPQKKNRRRIIFLILLALLPFIGIYVGYKFKNRGTVPISASSISTAPTSSLKVPEVNRPAKTITESQTNSEPNQPNGSSNNHQNSNTKITGTGNRYIQKQSLSQHKTLIKNQNNKIDIAIAGNSQVNTAGKKTSEETSSPDSDSHVVPGTTTDIRNNVTTDSLLASKQPNVAGKSNNKDTSKNKSMMTAVKGNNRFKHYWIISAASGPDISAVKLDNTGKITLQYGVQLGYAISQRFTLHTGFFISKKIYSVDADEYHGQGSYYNNYLQSIDANCKVYEIPLMASYNFARTKKGGWFASAGLSSYFMKKESYDFLYKYPGGATYTDNYTISNKNKHYFSIIDISAGYDRVISKRISIAAEPYMKFPVTGIGNGKIKLNSAGVLFSVNIKPFK